MLVLIEGKTLRGTGSFVASYFAFYYYISRLGFIPISTFCFTSRHPENIQCLVIVTFLLFLLCPVCYGKSIYQWKTFSENCQPVMVRLWFVCKITQNNCRSRLFTKFIQTQKRYSTTNLKAIGHIKQKILWLTSSLGNISYLSLWL